MLPVEEMRILDRNLEHMGFSIEALMERAGSEVARVVLRELKGEGKRVAVLCGAGNNGGDGLVAARHLHGVARVTVVLAKPPEAYGAGPARTNLDRLPAAVERFINPDRPSQVLASQDVLVDALLGSGVRGALREPYASLVRAINGARKPVVSVDIPSGFGGDLLVKPTVTVALHTVKEGMTKENSGRILVVDIGIPKEAEDLVGPGEFLLYPVPEEGSHKGNNGRVLVVGGGPFTGAPVFSASAAYAIGVDIAHLAVPRGIFTIVASQSPNFIVHPLPSEGALGVGDVERVLQVTRHADVLAIGPGLGADPGTLRAVQAILRGYRGPVVVDADAIRAVAEDRGVLGKREVVITPHHGEFKVLTGKDVPRDEAKARELVRAEAKAFGATLVVKGKEDLVSDGRRIKVVRGGTPAMTVGGTGDVLTGIIAGLMAKGLGGFDAGRLGAFTNKMAGLFAFREKSYGMTAVDVVEKVPQVLVTFLEPTPPRRPLARTDG